ncbi:MAG: response regulator [Nitriliruptorales bacterium]
MSPDRPITLVIADDNSGTRTLLRTLARRDGRFEIVGEAADGLDAVAVTREAQPDAILLDIMMPVVNGLEAIPDILEVAARTRIVCYSAYEGYRDEAMDLGAHGWCTKGWPWSEVAAAVIRLVGGREGVAAKRSDRESG